MVFPLLDLDAELVRCECSIGSATKQCRINDKDADQRKQLESGASKKAEVAKRVRTDRKCRNMQEG